MVKTILGVCFTALMTLVSIPVHAQDPLYKIQTSLQNNSSELVIDFEDTEEVSNACDFYVQRFEYIPAVNALMVSLSSEPCFLDVVGKRHGHLVWKLPTQYYSKQKQFCLIVNNESVGNVRIENNQSTFQVNSNKFCL